MSSLSNRTKLVYVPVLKDGNNRILYEGSDYEDAEVAIQEAHNYLAKELDATGLKIYMYAVIETRIVPEYI